MQFTEKHIIHYFLYQMHNHKSNGNLFFQYKLDLYK